MSVAFRRESDEEHKEPKFEVPIPPGPNLVTARGLALIEARVAALEGEIEAVIGDEAIATAKHLRYWRARLATARPMPVFTGDEVAFGARVTIRMNGAERVIAIVGDDEADPAGGRLSFQSPLARALIGGCPGDRVDFAGKSGGIEIVHVEAI